MAFLIEAVQLFVGAIVFIVLAFIAGLIAGQIICWLIPIWDKFSWWAWRKAAYEREERERGW